MNVKLSEYVIYVKVVIYLLLCNSHDCTFKFKSDQLFTIPKNDNQKTDDCYIEFMHLLKI